MKSIREEFKQKGIFYTPPELAEFLLKYVDFKPRDVYDPTCGDGGLLSVFGNDIPKYGQEINEEQIEVARQRLQNFTGYQGDTLETPMLHQKFHLIMGNPPFSIKWNPHQIGECPYVAPPSKADYAFLLHIIEHLADDGKAVVLNFPGILYRGNKEGKIRQWLVEKNYIERVVAIPPNQFVDTTISTALLVLSKHKTTKDIIFEDVAISKERAVPFEEIKGNGFILSVSNYVFEEIQKPQINPIELENNARANFKKKLIAELKFELAVCELEMCDCTSFLNELIEIIERFKKEANNDIRRTDKGRTKETAHIDG